MYSLSLLFCQSSLNTMSSTVYLSSFEVFMLLAFIPHPISSFLVICFVLPITRTPANFFYFPWRFELSGIDCSWKRTRSCEQRKSKVSSCNRESVRIKDIKTLKSQMQGVFLGCYRWRSIHYIKAHSCLDTFACTWYSSWSVVVTAPTHIISIIIFISWLATSGFFQDLIIKTI